MPPRLFSLPRGAPVTARGFLRGRAARPRIGCSWTRCDFSLGAERPVPPRASPHWVTGWACGRQEGRVPAAGGAGRGRVRSVHWPTVPVAPGADWLRRAGRWGGQGGELHAAEAGAARPEQVRPAGSHSPPGAAPAGPARPLTPARSCPGPARSSGFSPPPPPGERGLPGACPCGAGGGSAEAAVAAPRPYRAGRATVGPGRPRCCPPRRGVAGERRGRPRGAGGLKAGSR